MNFAMATSLLAWSVIVSYSVTCMRESAVRGRVLLKEGPFRVRRSGRVQLATGLDSR